MFESFVWWVVRRLAVVLIVGVLIGCGLTSCAIWLGGGMR